MTPAFDRELRIVETMLGLPEPERAAHIAQACGADDALRARVEDLLARLERGDASTAMFAKLLPGLEAAAARVGEGESGGTVAVSGGAATDSAWRVFLEKLASRGPLHTRYVLKGEIARGGMGVILRVHDEDVQRPLAMKVVLGQGDAEPTGKTPPVDDRTLGRFLEEAQVTGQLDHPGIVPVHDIGVDAQGRVFFTMKLVKGEDFRSVIEKVHGGDEEWSLPRALSVIQRVCEAMSYAHAKGVIHRDLKPGNVMVGRFGEVYVMDWGLARVLGNPESKDVRIRPAETSETALRSERRDTASDTPDEALLTMDGDVVGTPAYMPPEQAAGKIDEVGPAADVYAVGAMLYHLLAGRMPYVAPGAQISNRTILARVLDGPPKAIDQVAKGISPELTAICERAMSREIATRYATMQALADDFRAYLETRVVQAHRTGAIAELRMWVRRNRTLASVAAVAIIAITIGLVATLVLYRRADNNWQLFRAALRRAHGLRLATESKNLLTSNPTLALLLAIEAGAQVADPLTDAALQQSLLALTEERTIALPELTSLDHGGGRSHDIRFLALDAAESRLLCGGQHFAGILDLAAWQWTTSQDLGDATACAGGFFADGPRVLVAHAPLQVRPSGASEEIAETWLQRGPEVMDPITGTSLVVMPPISIGPTETAGTVRAAFDPSGSRVACALGSRGMVFDATRAGPPVRFSMPEHVGSWNATIPMSAVTFLRSGRMFVVNRLSSLSVVHAETGEVHDLFPIPPPHSERTLSIDAWIVGIAAGSDDSILMLDTAGVIRSLEPASGAERWRRTGFEHFKAFAASEQDRIYAIAYQSIGVESKAEPGSVATTPCTLNIYPTLAWSPLGERVFTASGLAVSVYRDPITSPYRIPREEYSRLDSLLQDGDEVRGEFEHHVRGPGGIRDEGPSPVLSGDLRHTLSYDEKYVRIHDRETGTLVSTLRVDHTRFAAFCRDESHVLIVPLEGPIEHWPIDLLGEAQRRAPRPLTSDERERLSVPDR